MTASAGSLSAPLPLAPSRAIVHRGRGARHGPITRLMSPGDVGQLVKPFVFLDLFEAENFSGGGFAPHPHSGIATLTTFLKGAVGYADSTGQSGTLSDGSVEWMRAGRGVWHTGFPIGGEPILGYQLWLALPPQLELAPPESRYLGPETIASTGPARVLLGEYEGVTGPITLPVPLTYLHVRLKDGERWTYKPAPDHDVAWLALNSGRIHVANSVLEREIAVFEEGATPIELVAEGGVEFVIGSSTKHPHPLVMGNYSVHTSARALTEGEANIAKLSRSPEVIALKRR